MKFLKAISRQFSRIWNIFVSPRQTFVDIKNQEKSVSEVSYFLYTIATLWIVASSVVLFLSDDVVPIQTVVISGILSFVLIILISFLWAYIFQKIYHLVSRQKVSYLHALQLSVYVRVPIFLTRFLPLSLGSFVINITNLLFIFYSFYLLWIGTQLFFDRFRRKAILSYILSAIVIGIFSTLIQFLVFLITIKFL